MSSKWEGGKGDKPRPIKNRRKFEENWDRIFNKKKNIKEKNEQDQRNQQIR